MGMRCAAMQGNGGVGALTTLEAVCYLGTPSCHGAWLPDPTCLYHWQIGRVLQELGLRPAAFQHCPHGGPLIQRPLHYALQLCLQTSIYSTCSLHSAVLHLCWLHDVSPVQSTHRPDQLSPQSWRVSIWNASTIEFTSSPSQRQLHLNDMQRRFQVRHVRGAGPPNVKASNSSRVLLSNGPD